MLLLPCKQFLLFRPATLTAGRSAIWCVHLPLQMMLMEPSSPRRLMMVQSHVSILLGLFACSVCRSDVQQLEPLRHAFRRAETFRAGQHDALRIPE